MLDESPDHVLPAAWAVAIDQLKEELAALPPARRQALALRMAARLVEESAYFTASDGTLPVTTRLMMWAHDLERMSDQFSRAA